MWSLLQLFHRCIVIGSVWSCVIQCLQKVVQSSSSPIPDTNTVDLLPPSPFLSHSLKWGRYFSSSCSLILSTAKFRMAIYLEILLEIMVVMPSRKSLLQCEYVLVQQRIYNYILEIQPLPISRTHLSTLRTGRSNYSLTSGRICKILQIITRIKGTWSS